MLSSSSKENSITKDNYPGDTSGDKSGCSRCLNQRDLASTYVLHHPTLLVPNFGDWRWIGDDSEMGQRWVGDD